MTSAHRPTWSAAIASGTNPGGNSFSCQTSKVANRDAASFLKIKTRQPGQGLVEERGSKKELREELEAKEQKAREERLGLGGGEAKAAEPQPKLKAIEANPFPEDEDDDAPAPSEASDKEGDDDDDDEDTEELMRELAKIKKEREAEEQVHKAKANKMDERARRDEVAKGNPLLMGDESDLSLKRKWDDDTVFKNQARTAPKMKQRYINDSVRSDFHKKFLNKYVWVDGVAH
mmetsp:Transcript_7507/g.27582  ORF Transcript_7507/g.27582 Transcript_7507/m.27582 type:complete len:232 (+) Transcript_7507:67-762(+)